MNSESFQPRHKSVLTSLTLIGLLVICVITVVAQSGRRARKPTTVPAPTPEASPTPTAEKSPEKSALPVFIGIERDSFTNIPLYFYDSVLKSCADRLDDRSSIKVEVSSRDMSRVEAVKRAKSLEEGYVVLLQLQGDRGSSNQDLSQLYVEYFVFAAGSARRVTSGSAYQQAAGFKDIMVGRTGRGTTAQIEYRLKEAAGVAAERILASLTTNKLHDTHFWRRL